MTRILSLFTLAALVTAAVLAVAPGLVEAGGGGHGCRKSPSLATGTTVAINDACFGPTLLYVEPGTTVTFENHDFMPHNVFSSDNVALVESSQLQPGQEAAIAVEQAGVLLYYCSIHPLMVGVIIAGDELGTAARVSGDSGAAGLPLKVDPPAANEDVPASGMASDKGDSGLPVAAAAGIAIAVGLVSAGGGFALRRRD
jgi:plastocyanin